MIETLMRRLGFVPVHEATCAAEALSVEADRERHRRAIAEDKLETVMQELAQVAGELAEMREREERAKNRTIRQLNRDLHALHGRAAALDMAEVSA